MKRLVVKLWPLIHPLLFAVFPILFLYTHNLSETSANQIYLPILFSVVAAVLLWALLSLLLRSTFKGGLATTIFVIFFFSYGRLYDLLQKWNVDVLSHGILLPGMLLAWCYCVYFIKLAKRDFRNTTTVLNALAVVLILVNLFSIVSYQIGKPSLLAGNVTQTQAGSTPAGNSSEAGTMPDIYYVILDEYAHPDTMEKYYDYDNSQFISSLVDMGFFVAEESRTRYQDSRYVLASVLNMEYISEALPEEAACQKISHNVVCDYLKQRGYKRIYFGSWYELGQWKVDADIYHNFYQSAGGSSLAAAFPSILWKTTMLAPFYDHIAHGQYESYYRGGLLDTLEELGRTPEVAGPKFVFADILCPHSPFVFGPNGEPVDPVNYMNWEDRQYYLNQYIFMTHEIQRTVGLLLERSNGPTIIILQSDHGPRSSEGWQKFPELISSREWERILNAWYLPDEVEDGLYVDISPVNTFRFLFNHLFGTDYDMLED